MSTTPKYRVIVHPVRKARPATKTKPATAALWTWTQVARNGSAGAVAPKTYDSKSNAVRAAQRQVDALNWGIADEGLKHLGAAVSVDETYRRGIG